MERERTGGLVLRLSPRMRGNRRVEPFGDSDAASIPAYAGEPIGSFTAAYRPHVYPRVCGGTMDNIVSQLTAQRLSPRMRGNPWQ